jgi:hypothetical protein
MTRQDVIKKVTELMYANYNNIVFTPVNSHVCYAILGIGLRIYCFKDHIKVRYKNKVILELHNKEYTDMFKVCIDCTNAKETESYKGLFDALESLPTTEYTINDNQMYNDLEEFENEIKFGLK